MTAETHLVTVTEAFQRVVRVPINWGDYGLSPEASEEEKVRALQEDDDPTWLATKPDWSVALDEDPSTVSYDYSHYDVESVRVEAPSEVSRVVEVLEDLALTLTPEPDDRCSHALTGDGSPVHYCGTCMYQAASHAAVKEVRAAIERVKREGEVPGSHTKNA